MLYTCDGNGDRDRFLITITLGCIIALGGGIALIISVEYQLPPIKCELINIISRECVDGTNGATLYLKGIMQINNISRIVEGIDICTLECQSCQCNYISRHSYYCYYDGGSFYLDCMDSTWGKPYGLSLGLILLIGGILAIPILIYAHWYNLFQTSEPKKEEMLSINHETVDIQNYGI